MGLPATDIESIERATLAAVAPERVEQCGDWLLPMDSGTVGRAHSAVPLHHGFHGTSLIDTIATAYRRAGHEPVFRLPQMPALEPWFAALTERGYRHTQPTHTMTGTLDGLLKLGQGADGDQTVMLETRPDDPWMAMFLGPGLDPVDGASRSRSLARAQDTLYASLRLNGQTLACGAACLAQGWLSVHGLRTYSAHRGQGLASRVLCAMALQAQHLGIDRVFLQVDAQNRAALSLYRRAGLRTAWVYGYWRLPRP